MGSCYEIYSEIDLYGHRHFFSVLSRFLLGQRENNIHVS